MRPNGMTFPVSTVPTGLFTSTSTVEGNRRKAASSWSIEVSSGGFSEQKLTMIMAKKMATAEPRGKVGKFGRVRPKMVKVLSTSPSCTLLDGSKPASASWVVVNVW